MCRVLSPIAMMAAAYTPLPQRDEVKHCAQITKDVISSALQLDVSCELSSAKRIRFRSSWSSLSRKHLKKKLFGVRSRGREFNYALSQEKQKGLCNVQRHSKTAGTEMQRCKKRTNGIVEDR